MSECEHNKILGECIECELQEAKGLLSESVPISDIQTLIAKYEKIIELQEPTDKDKNIPGIICAAGMSAVIDEIKSLINKGKSDG